MIASVHDSSHAAIWRRAITPAKKSLDAAAAKALLELKLSTKDLRRADLLAVRAAAGKLTAKEAVELENYRGVGAALEFLKAKARSSLARR